MCDSRESEGQAGKPRDESDFVRLIKELKRCIDEYNRQPYPPASIPRHLLEETRQKRAASRAGRQAITSGEQVIAAAQNALYQVYEEGPPCATGVCGISEEHQGPISQALDHPCPDIP